MGVIAALALLAVAIRTDLDLSSQAAASTRDNTRLASPATAPAAPPRDFAPMVSTAAGGQHWLASWGAAPQPASRQQPVSMRGFRHQTLRQVVFASAGGNQVRIRFTNQFGTRPLLIGAASVALQGDGAGVMAGSIRQLTFAGSPDIAIPRGAEALSDPVSLEVSPLTRLSVSTYLPVATGHATQHAQSSEVSYVAGGSHVLQTSGVGFRRQMSSWYFLDAVETLSPAEDVGAVIALGDSITDGVGSTVGADATWPDDLARRLSGIAGSSLSVLDEGIGGNRLLNSSPCCGPNAVARFNADVASQPGARDVILLEGINDLGFSQKRGRLSAPHTNVTAREIAAGDEQIIAQAHADGLKIFGATLTLFKGARYWTPGAERKREAINNWILHSGAFDGVIDFARVLANSRHPQRLNPGYDSGDHLHPNNAGYRAMADAVDLVMLFEPTS